MSVFDKFKSEKGGKKKEENVLGKKNSFDISFEKNDVDIFYDNTEIFSNLEEILIKYYVLT